MRCIQRDMAVGEISFLCLAYVMICYYMLYTTRCIYSAQTWCALRLWVLGGWGAESQVRHYAAATEMLTLTLVALLLEGNSVTVWDVTPPNLKAKKSVIYHSSAIIARNFNRLSRFTY